MSFTDDLLRFKRLKMDLSMLTPTSPAHRNIVQELTQCVGHHSSARCREDEAALLIIILDELPYEEVWRRWAPEKNLHIFIHAKFPEKVKSKWVVKHLIHSNLNPEWGSHDLLKVELLLLEKALETRACRFLFVSESCVPVVPYETFAKLQTPYSWLSTRSEPENGYVESGQFLPLSKHIPRLYISKASQWCLLTRKDARDILSCTDKLLQLFLNVHCSDEMFFATTLNLLGRTVENTHLTYTKWKDICDKSPCVLGVGELEEVLSSPGGVLFARKVKTHLDTVLKVLHSHGVLLP